jgi:molecular chaperone Hsp33
MTSFDFFQRFHFESLGIRGELVRLNKSWQQAKGETPYPPHIAARLGESLCAAVLLSGTIKFNGSLILQMQSSGPLRTLVAQATHLRTIRGLAHWSESDEASDLQQLCPDGRLVITIQNQDNEPYQGIVAIDEKTIAHSLERYFLQSEQLPTRLWLHADQKCATGLFLQVLPGTDLTSDGWNRILHLTETITSSELMSLPSEELLFRLYHEEQVRLSNPEPVIFRCGCQRERIETVLVTLGPEEINETLEEQGAIEVHCDFCNRLYRFDRVDVAALFNEKTTLRHPGSSQH